jgi:predicted DNA-binding transcriptional regulator AlpA
MTSIPRYIDEREYARIRACAIGTVRNERWRGAGPPVYRIGGRQVRYRLDEVLAWIEGFREAGR